MSRKVHKNHNNINFITEICMLHKEIWDQDSTRGTCSSPIQKVNKPPKILFGHLGEPRFQRTQITRILLKYSKTNLAQIDLSSITLLWPPLYP